MAEDMSTLGAELSGGGTIPLLGFGTWRLEGEVAYKATLTALEIGYRHIDTATAYGNEERVGAAIRQSGVGRGAVFVTTKCPPERSGQALETLDESLTNLGVDYVDLWLVHWPPAGQARPDMWEKFIEARNLGKAAHIGVSNYTVAQVDELAEATGEAPEVNQIPWSPFLYHAATARALADRHVVLEGYSPLLRSNLGHRVLNEVARAHGKTPAQVVLRWHIEHGFVVIPKSAHRERIEENFDLGFTLSPDEVRQIDALAR
jgi:2,5-diketo-D-gluconate reductase A